MKRPVCTLLTGAAGSPFAWAGELTSAPAERRWLIALVVALLCIPVGFVVRKTVLGSIQKLAARTAWSFDDELVQAVRRPFVPWFFLGGLVVAARIAPLESSVRAVVDGVVTVAFIVSVTLWAAGAAVRLLERTGASSSEGPESRSVGVVRYVVRLGILASGALVLLGTLGVSITPVLTTVGVGGLAVALGLQATLANLFAGMQVTLAGNLRVGDFVKLESGEEGFIDDVQWRVTRVRTLPNNFVLVPNSRFAESVVTNYSRPTADLAVLVQVGVHYASDLERVERVTCDVARQIMRTVPGAVPEFEPFVRFHTFGPSSIDFSVIMRGKTFVDQFLVKHEFVKALKRAYDAENITIPFPIVALNVAQEQGRAAELPAAPPVERR